MTEEPISERGSEVAILRRELDRQLTHRLDHVETELTGLKERLIEQAHQLRQISEQQAEQSPALVTINRMMASGVVLRWMVTLVVGILGCLAAVATAWETIQKWSK